MNDKDKTKLFGKPRPQLTRKGDSLVGTDASGDLLDKVLDEGQLLPVHLATRGALVAGAIDEAPFPWLAASLDVASVAELVTVVTGGGQTGALEVHTKEGIRRLFFVDGQFRGSQSTHKDDRTGEVLWRMGLISLDQLVIATEYHSEKKRIGQTLVELGYCTRAQLREGLREQARFVFEAACLAESGMAIFVSGKSHPNPVRFGSSTDSLVDEVLDVVAEVVQLRAKLKPLDAPCRPSLPLPGGKRSEGEEALLQLAQSAKTPLTRAVLLEKSGLGTVTGLRALSSLIDQGCFLDDERTLPRKRPVLTPSRIERFCRAINRIMEVLDETGFGAGDEVREFVDNPPDAIAESLSAISLDSPLDAQSVRDQAEFLDGGERAMAAALDSLLDFAMFQARDMLDEDDAERLFGELSKLVGVM